MGEISLHKRGQSSLRRFLLKKDEGSNRALLFLPMKRKNEKESYKTQPKGLVGHDGFEGIARIAHVQEEEAKLMTAQAAAHFLLLLWRLRDEEGTEEDLAVIAHDCRSFISMQKDCVEGVATTAFRRASGMNVINRNKGLFPNARGVH